VFRITSNALISTVIAYDRVVESQKLFGLNLFAQIIKYLIFQQLSQGLFYLLEGIDSIGCIDRADYFFKSV
jgi:hypothetical protein